jgi:hypothetical protein
MIKRGVVKVGGVGLFEWIMNEGKKKLGEKWVMET